MPQRDMDKALGFDQNMTQVRRPRDDQENHEGTDADEGQSTTTSNRPYTQYDILAPFTKADAEKVCILCSVQRTALTRLILSRSAWSPSNTLGLFLARTPLVR